MEAVKMISDVTIGDPNLKETPAVILTVVTDVKITNTSGSYRLETTRQKIKISPKGVELDGSPFTGYSDG